MSYVCIGIDSEPIGLELKQPRRLRTVGLNGKAETTLIQRFCSWATVWIIRRHFRKVLILAEYRPQRQNLPRRASGIISIAMRTLNAINTESFPHRARNLECDRTIPGNCIELRRCFDSEVGRERDSESRVTSQQNQFYRDHEVIRCLQSSRFAGQPDSRPTGRIELESACTHV